MAKVFCNIGKWLKTQQSIPQNAFTHYFCLTVTFWSAAMCTENIDGNQLEGAPKHPMAWTP